MWHLLLLDLNFTELDAAGSIPLQTFLHLPGDIDFNSSLQFSPSKGTIDPHSLKVGLKVDSVHVSVDVLRSLYYLVKDGHQSESTYPPYEPPSSVSINATETLSAKTPMSPFIEALRSVRTLMLHDLIH